MSNVSVKKKILYSFAIIAFIMLTQAAVSGNSVRIMYANNYFSTEQGTIKELSLYIQKQQAREEADVKEWASGVEMQQYEPLFAINKFNTDANLTQDALDQLSIRIENLNKNNDIKVVNFTYPITLLESITTEFRPDYLDSVRNIIFKMPSLKTISDIKQVAEGTNTAAYQITNELALWLLNRNQTSVTRLNQLDYALKGYVLQMSIAIAPIQYFNQSLYNQKLLYKDVISEQSELISDELGSIIDIARVNNTLYELPIDKQNELSQRLTNLNGNITILTSAMNELISIEDYTETVLKSNLGIISNKLVVINSYLTSLTEWAQQSQNLVKQDVNRRIVLQLIVILITVLVSFIVLLVLTALINRNVLNPIKTITRWSEYIADGDLSHTRPFEKRYDEVGVMQQNFRVMNNNLRDIIGKVKDSAILISETAEELASNAEELNATSEEVSSIAQHMASGSTQQAEIIQRIVEEIQEANRVVDSVISQITENLSIVKDLSEQTNVLALNTAIEAANAGEYGRGFAVIADRIRKMSDQSARTAKLITRDSKAILKQLQTSFGSITEQIENVAAVSEETAASAEEVSASAEEMTATMQSIAAKTILLNDESTSNQKLVERFHLGSRDEIENEENKDKELNSIDTSENNNDTNSSEINDE